MGEADFLEAIAAARKVLDRPLINGGIGLSDALRAVEQARPWDMSEAAVAAVLDLAFAVLGIEGDGLPAGLDERMIWVVPAQARDLLADTVRDPGVRNRDFVAKMIQTYRDHGEPLPEDVPQAPIPPARRRLTAAAGRALLAPYFAHWEPQIAQTPLAHLQLCWDVLTQPVAPFPDVFRDWLDDMDRRGLAGGDSRRALERAVDFVARAEAVEDFEETPGHRMTWDAVEADLLPQLQDDHPLVAATAARYLGALWDSPSGFVEGNGDRWSLAQMLEHLRTLPKHRRAVAGGFLNGYAGVDDPIHSVSDEGVDIDAWVMDILSDGEAEPYLPGVQAFWFYVHEAYACDPAFVTRLIEAGHVWIAMMCATESHEPVAGMRPVLERLAACDDAEIAEPAGHWLHAHY